MKAKITFFSLAAAGVILSACATGSPAAVDHFGNMQPIINNYTPGAASDSIQIEESNSWLPVYNPDGSITIMNVGGWAVKVLPMTERRTRGDLRTRGALNRTTEEFDIMIAQYTEALRKNPQDYDACIILAGLYIDRGNPGDAELAVKYSDQALAISKNDPQALYARGLAYAEQGESAKALADLEAVLKTNLQSMKGVYYVMGMIQYKSGKIDEAIDAFEKVRTLDPGFGDTDEVLEELYKLKA
jgi:tetratricopeptide (TPR) repeat protein